MLAVLPRNAWLTGSLIYDNLLYYINESGLRTGDFHKKSYFG